MGNHRVIQLNNKDERFYPMVGPLLSRREVVKELGFPIWDEDGKEWFVVTDRNQVIGVSAVRVEKGKKAVLCSAYVKPSHRRKGIYRALTEAREVWIKRQGVKDTVAAATAATLPLLQAKGFSVVRVAGRYTHVRKVQ